MEGNQEIAEVVGGEVVPHIASRAEHPQRDILAERAEDSADQTVAGADLVLAHGIGEAERQRVQAQIARRMSHYGLAHQLSGAVGRRGADGIGFAGGAVEAPTIDLAARGCVDELPPIPAFRECVHGGAERVHIDREFVRQPVRLVGGARGVGEIDDHVRSAQQVAGGACVRLLVGDAHGKRRRRSGTAPRRPDLETRLHRRARDVRPQKTVAPVQNDHELDSNSKSQPSSQHLTYRRASSLRGGRKSGQTFHPTERHLRA